MVGGRNIGKVYFNTVTEPCQRLPRHLKDTDVLVRGPLNHQLVDDFGAVQPARPSRTLACPNEQNCVYYPAVPVRPRSRCGDACGSERTRRQRWRRLYGIDDGRCSAKRKQASISRRPTSCPTTGAQWDLRRIGPRRAGASSPIRKRRMTSAPPCTSPRSTTLKTSSIEERRSTN